MNTAGKTPRILSVLMERDGITKAEAMEMVRECREAMAGGDLYALQDYLGLEDDYIFDVI